MHYTEPKPDRKFRTASVGPDSKGGMMPYKSGNRNSKSADGGKKMSYKSGSKKMNYKNG